MLSSSFQVVYFLTGLTYMFHEGFHYADLGWFFFFFADTYFFSFAVSGLSGDGETAQSQVSVGMGLLAGSTVMLLTVIWGSCIIVGKCDIQDNIAKENQDTRGFSLTGSSLSLPRSLYSMINCPCICWYIG